MHIFDGKKLYLGSVEMLTLVEQIQDEINNKRKAIEQEKSNGQQANYEQINQWENEITVLEMKLTDAKAEEANQQTLEQRVEEDIRDNGYVLDTLEVDGLTMPEIITDDVQYDYARRGVQILVVGMNTSHANLINALQAEKRHEVQLWTERANQAEQSNEQLKKDNQTFETTNFQLMLDNEALDEKVRKGADQLYEATQQIEQQKQHIEDLRNQQAIGIRQALNIVTEPQDTTRFKAEIDASKPRITDVKYKDEFGIDRRTKTAVEVLTGKEIEYQEYVEKRYIILNFEEAAQYKAEHEQKKLEAEALNIIVPTLEQKVDPVDIPVQEVHNEEVTPFHNEEPHTTELGLVDQSLSLSGTEAEETTVITLESLKAELDSLKSAHETTATRVGNIERHANIQAVA